MLREVGISRFPHRLELPGGVTCCHQIMVRQRRPGQTKERVGPSGTSSEGFGKLLFSLLGTIQLEQEFSIKFVCRLNDPRRTEFQGQTRLQGGCLGKTFEGLGTVSLCFKQKCFQLQCQHSSNLKVLGCITG